MILKLKYFGMVAEAVAKNEESFSFSKKTIEELDSDLKNKYKKLENLNYKFAINKTMAEQNDKVNNNDEIALLPPFAGG